MKTKLLTALAIILFALAGTAVVAYLMGAFDTPITISQVRPYCVQDGKDQYFLAGSLQDGSVLTYNTKTGASSYRKIPTEPRVDCTFSSGIIVRSFIQKDTYSIMGRLVEVPKGTMFFDGELHTKGTMPDTQVCATQNALLLSTADGFLVDIYCNRQYMGMVVPSTIASAKVAVASTPVPTITPYAGIPTNLGDPIRFMPNTEIKMDMVFRGEYVVEMLNDDGTSSLANVGGKPLCKVVDNWTNKNVWVVRCYGTDKSRQAKMTVGQIWHAATGRGPVDWLKNPINLDNLWVTLKAGAVVYKDNDFHNVIGTYPQPIICQVQGARSSGNMTWPESYKLDCGWIHPSDLTISVPAGVSAIPDINSATPTIKRYGHINDDGVRMRRTPEVRNDNILLKLSKDIPLTIEGDAEQHGDLSWLPVKVGDTTGWVVSDYVTIDE